MKLASYRYNENDSFGIVIDKGIIDLIGRLGHSVIDLKSLLAHGIKP